MRCLLLSRNIVGLSLIFLPSRVSKIFVAELKNSPSATRCPFKGYRQETDLKCILSFSFTNIVRYISRADLIADYAHNVKLERSIMCSENDEIRTNFYLYVYAMARLWWTG